MADVSYGNEAPQLVNIIVEIQRGGRNKYETDKDSGLLVLDRVNVTALSYPADYAYIPQTLAEDGDPLDALLIIDEPVMPGVMVKARVIGWMDMVDDGENDQKVICVAADDVSKDHLKDITDIDENWKQVVQHFFTHLKDFKKNWQGAGLVTIKGFGSKDEAYQLIQTCIDRAKK